MEVFYPDQPALYDLNAFAKKLPIEPRFHKIKGIVRKLHGYGSSHNDLTLAYQYLVVSSEIDKNLDAEYGIHPSNRMIAIGGMQSWSAILYTRATEPARGGDTRFSVQGKLEGRELQWHRTIVGLRNDALAHYGVGPVPTNPWSADGIVMRTRPSRISPTDVELKLFHPPLRTNFSAEIGEGLALLIPKAVQLVDAAIALRESEFYEEYESLARTGHIVRKALDDSIWDPQTIWNDVPHDHIIERMMASEGTLDYPEMAYVPGRAIYAPPK